MIFDPEGSTCGNPGRDLFAARLDLPAYRGRARIVRLGCHARATEVRVMRGRLVKGTGTVLATVMGLAVSCSSSVASVAGSGPKRRPPAGRVAWQWELDRPLNLRSRLDLGIGDETYLGKRAVPPVIYDIDGFDNRARTIRAVHRRHDHVICYIEVGAAENYRPDYKRFLKSVLGRQVPGYPAERYLDIARKPTGTASTRWQFNVALNGRYRTPCF